MFKQKRTTVEAGALAEELACRFLLQQGLIWVESNYRCHCGEIDLIMQDGDYLVFVEVRARTSASFGGALASVTYQKQQKILKSALHYLAAKKKYQKQPLRFDVLGLAGRSAQIEWIKNAFGLDF